MVQPPFRVTPDSIVFRDLVLGESDSMGIWVQNVSKVPLQIRFVMPAMSPFVVSSDCDFITTPGLSCDAVIHYTAKSASVVKDFLKVVCQNYEVSIPLVATPPSMRIVCDKTNYDLGNVGVGSERKFTFTLSNLGSIPGNFVLKSDESDLKLLPESVAIAAGKSQEIMAFFNPKNLGNYSFDITMKGEAGPEATPKIHVTASAVPHSLSLIVGDKEASDLEFGTIFTGQKRVIKGKLVNKGPYKRSFVIFASSDSSTKLANATDATFTAYPQEGFVNAYGSMDVKFIFNPPPSEPISEDMETDFTQGGLVEVVETGQRIEFLMTARTVNHYVDLSEMDFIFEGSAVHSRSIKPLILINGSHFLETTFEIKQVAHFHFEPIKGVIGPEDKKTVNVVFYPRSLGLFEISTTVNFGNGLEIRRINLSGLCSGGGECKKFRRVPVWETDAEARFLAERPDPRFAYDLTRHIENLQKRQENDNILKRQAKARAREEESAALRRQAETYLSKTVGTYTEKEVREFMIKHSEKVEELHEGLTPPQPEVIKTPSPLFLAKPERFGLSKSPGKEMIAMQMSVVSRRIATYDEMTPVKKKFKAKPTTPGEINECIRPLTPAQQLSVVASHQSINFGQIAVFSVATRSFTISNDLQQHILVTMAYECEELGRSIPLAQVIPPRTTAGFDVIFVSRKAQNFAKTIQYTVNGHHSYAVSVAAQVIPIEVQLSKTYVEFRFSPDSVSPVMREFVTISNRSNARAEFSFSGLAPPFSMLETSCHIEPLKSMNVEIVYQPTTHAHDELMLVMNVIGGASHALKLVGDTGVAKCSVSKKTVNFGLIPIGIRKSQTLKLKNSGDDDGIFSITINSNDLIITPQNGRVPAHDSQTLTVQYRSTESQYFDIPCTIQICGSPPIHFNVSGQSELPDVHIQKSEFEFGRIFVGSCASIDATLINSGQIPAILFLDLKSRPEFRIEFSNEYEQNGIISIIADSTAFSRDDQISARSQSSSNEGLCYKFQLAENTNTNFSLVFQPRKPGDHSFELPLTMMNVMNSSSFHLQPLVSCEAIGAPLIISKSTIAFGVSAIYDRDNPNSRAQVRVLTLTNQAKFRSAFNLRSDYILKVVEITP